MTSLKEQSAEECFNSGVQYYEQGNFILAIEELTKSIQLNLNAVEAYNKPTICYRNQEKYEVITITQETIKLESDIAEAYFGRSICYLMQENFELALNDVDNAIRLFDSSENKSECYFFAINIAIYAKEFDRARYYLEQAFKHGDSKELLHKAIYLLSIESAEELDRKNIELEELNEQLKDKNQHLEEVQKKLRELVQNTSHTAGNLLRPNTQEKIAKKLKNSEFIEESKKLYYASSDIKYVKQQFKLLEIMQSLTGSEAIRSQIKLDQVDKCNNQSMSIEDILNLAAFRAIDKLFDTNEYSLNFARETIEKKQGDFSRLSSEYQKYVLATNDDNDSLSIMSWCSKNLRPITINYKCDDWKKIFFHNNSQSVALFFCYFFELFFNAFKYADHNEYDFLTITLGSEVISSNEFLTMIWLNPKSNQTSFGSNKGLNLSASYISLLNDDKYKDKSQEVILHTDNTFELITRIDRNIFNL